jgi:hypothetical protein
VLTPQAEHTIDVSLGKYLAPGVHYLVAGPEHAEIWIDPRCDANNANCVTP